MIFGVAIRVTNRATGQLHVAAIYRLRGTLMIGELCDHFLTRRVEAHANEGILWVEPRLSEEERKFLAAKINAWLELNGGKIPYSVASPGGVIFRDDIWVGDSPGQGLTCATFIVELFKELGIPFIDSKSWRAREGDDEWARGILQMLRGCMSPEHVAAQMDLIGREPRIRPSDVAAAGVLISEAAKDGLSFDLVSPTSEEIEAKLLGQ